MFKLVKPSIKYKEKCISYINEFYEYNSTINGVGKLDYYLKNSNFENWLKYIDSLTNKSEYFLVNDENNIIGMINIRHSLDEKHKIRGGHIGYSIRPLERRKGYNKINFYLALEKMKELNVKEVLITCDDTNVASYKSIESLGGILIEKLLYEGVVIRRYIIDVADSLKKYRFLVK